MTWIQILRWFLLLGFLFQIGVSVWAIMMMIRMRREQAIAIAVLNTLAARAGLKQAIDHIQREQ